MIRAAAGFGAAFLPLALALAHDAAVIGAEERRRVAFDLQAHRGGRALWPENTLAAFSAALALGVSTLELDCAVTKDGVVVVSHDPVLNPDHTRDDQGRFLEAPGPPLFEQAYDELRRFDVGRLRPGSAYAARFPDQQQADGQRIPRLSDVFALARSHAKGEVRFNVETKVFPDRPGLTLAPEPFAEAVVRVVREAGMEAGTTIQSFDWRTLRHVQKIAPRIETVALTTQRPGEDGVQIGRPGPSAWLGGLDADDFGGSVPRLVKASGAVIWSPHYQDLDAGRVEEAHALGLRVVPWTINETADMERLLDWKVDGIITDRPDRLRAVLQAKGIAVPRPAPAR